MKHDAATILLFGQQKNLLETRQWVLQSRGYRVLMAEDLAQLAAIPQSRPVDLLLLCYTLSPRERARALALARSRWPGCRELTLRSDGGRAPTGLLGQLLHTMDGPARLVSLVGDAMNAPEARAS